MLAGAVESIETSASLSAERDVYRESAPGPLFKEIYAGLMEVDDPAVGKSKLGSDGRSLLAHTTDIHTLDQFKTIHHTPEKWGTAYHHRTYLATVASLKG